MGRPSEGARDMVAVILCTRRPREKNGMDSPSLRQLIDPASELTRSDR
jgi:hypothetical protein